MIKSLVLAFIITASLAGAAPVYAQSDAERECSFDAATGGYTCVELKGAKSLTDLGDSGARKRRVVAVK
jgi:hypothetical protein